MHHVWQLASKMALNNPTFCCSDPCAVHSHVSTGLVYVTNRIFSSDSMLLLRLSYKKTSVFVLVDVCVCVFFITCSVGSQLPLVNCLKESLVNSAMNGLGSGPASPIKTPTPEVWLTP